MKIEVIIPNDLSEITLDQYQRFLKIQENNTDEKFLTSKMIEIFCGIKLPEVPVANKMMRADTLTQHQVAIFVWNEMSFNVMNFLVNGAV